MSTALCRIIIHYRNVLTTELSELKTVPNFGLSWFMLCLVPTNISHP